MKSKLRSLVAGHRRPGAFTLIELLVVMTIILILAGLILATSGYVQKKGARSRTETEIAALSAALESYKADNGAYVRAPQTDALDPIVDINPYPVPTPPPPNQYLTYTQASLYLYEQLSGDTGANLQPPANAKTYFAFQPSMLYTTVTTDSNGNTTTAVNFLRDPFGNSYGYSTAYQADPSKGYNPTFDLWSTASYRPPTVTPSPTPQDFWIKNW